MAALDLPDDALAELDWVVASVHYKLDQNPRDMTRRLTKAIRNHNVDAIGHPTGRLIGHREPSGLDFGELLRVAREEGCAMEIDSQPDRLDLTDTMCMAAKKAGVKLVITSDAHSPRELELLEYGVNQARRGWIEAERRAQHASTQIVAAAPRAGFRVSIASRTRRWPLIYASTATRSRSSPICTS